MYGEDIGPLEVTPPLPGWMETYPSPLGEGILTLPKWRENYPTQLKGDLSPPSRWWETLQELSILLNNSTQWPTLSSNLDPSPEVYHTKYTTITSPTLKGKKNILAKKWLAVKNAPIYSDKVL